MRWPSGTRLPSVGTTIFTVMSKLAAEVGADQPLAGIPGLRVRPGAVDAVARHMRAGLNQYAPMPGVPALRQAIAAKYARAHGACYDPDTEVTLRPAAPRRSSTRSRPPSIPATRSSSSSPATTRTCRRSSSTAACRWSCRCGCRTTGSTGTRSRRGDHAAHAAPDDQFAAQSDRLDPDRRTTSPR